MNKQEPSNGEKFIPFYTPMDIAPGENLVANLSRSLSDGLVAKVDQRVLVCIKPKPRYLTKKTWLKLATKFIYIEKTDPNYRITDRISELKREVEK